MDRGDIRVAVGTGSTLLALSVFIFILFPAPTSILFLGVILGALSSLVAMGLVLVYRANRIVNFAQGDLGGASGVLAASLIVGPRWNFFLALLVGLAFALALGALIEVGVVRRFANAPRLVLTVVTIGIGQLLGVVTLGLPQLFDYDTVPQPPVPFSFTFNWFPVTYRGGHLLILFVIPLVAVGLAVFFRRSRIGIAVRASSESATRAALLGIPVKRINTLVWVLAGGMSGLGVLLRLPIQGVAIGQVLGPSLLLRALAAAVIGRMESLPRTFAAAVVLGVVEQAVLFETGRTIVVDAVLFGVILVALLVERGGTVDRARDLGAASWAALREVRPIPRELATQPVVRGVVVGLGALVCLGLLVLPLGWSPSTVNLFGFGLLYAMIILSLVILTGWAGQISLGHLAVVAVGAAVTGTLHQQGKDLFVSLALSSLAGVAILVLIGVPALRIKGPFLAVTTLAFALATGTYFLNREFFPWLVPDPAVITVRPVLLGKFDLESEHTYYYVLLGALALVVAVVRRLQSSRTGRTLVATRDNARAAQSYGISPTVAQLTAFALSGAIAGLAGGLYFFQLRSLSGTLLRPEEGILLFAVAIIGGLGSIPAALCGAAYLTFVNFSSFTQEPISRLFASGIGVLAILSFLPGGLGGKLYDLRDALLRRFATARGIVVPSLLADVETEAGVAVVAASRGSAPSADPLLLVRDLEVSYGKTQVLFGVDFHVERGEIVALLGTNGAGKSTLLSAVSGLLTPGAGTMAFDGAPLGVGDPQSVTAKGIVLMPGGKGVFPTLTVEENLQLAGWLFAEDPAHVERVTAEVLGHFPVLRERWDQRAGNLSGGEQQMVTLGQALIAKPRLLLIDELSLGLAPIVVEQLLGIVRQIHAAGTTVVIVEQSVNVAITLAGRAVFMEKGQVRFDGPTAELLDHPEILRAVFLEGAGNATAPTSAPAAARRPVAPAATAVRRAPFEQRCDGCGREHHLALQLRGVSVRFGGVQAASGVDLDLREDQIIGIIGPNGAGKTTVLDLISGFLRPTAGRVTLGGTDVTDLPPHARALLGLGRSFQDARLFPSMTVRQTIATAFERHVAVPEPMAAVVLSPAVGRSERQVAEEVDGLIELMRLEAFADKFIGELSTGSRRVVDLACSLAHEPSVLLLDEPSSGIAQRETEALGPVLLDIREKTGAALIVIEHDMPLITSISDELIALELGAVIARGAPADVIGDPRVVAGYLGGTEAVINRSGGRGPGTDGRRRRAPLVATGR